MVQRPAHRELFTAAKFGAVGCIGLLTDIMVLRLGLVAGLSPLTARVISLTAAMQVTFLINGFVVFRCLKRETFLRQWSAYMSSNGFGNLCSYFIFAGLVLSHWPVVSHRGWALTIGSLFAYLINYAGARLFAFGHPRGSVLTPAESACVPVEAGAPAGL